MKTANRGTRSVRRHSAARNRKPTVTYTSRAYSFSHNRSPKEGFVGIGSVMSSRIQVLFMPSPIFNIMEFLFLGLWSHDDRMAAAALLSKSGSTEKGVYQRALLFNISVFHQQQNFFPRNLSADFLLIH